MVMEKNCSRPSRKSPRFFNGFLQFDFATAEDVNLFFPLAEMYFLCLSNGRWLGKDTLSVF